jgi:hypothetical protein
MQKELDLGGALAALRKSRSTPIRLQRAAARSPQFARNNPTLPQGQRRVAHSSLPLA